jgi:DNA-binding NarL/FixJ family response regulator
MPREPRRHRSPEVSADPAHPARPSASSAIADLAQVISALVTDTAALEREARAPSGVLSASAIDKLQAVIGELEIATLLVRRMSTDLRPDVNLLGVRGCSNEQRLSAREREVLAMLTRGCTVSEIARQRALSVNTVSTYRTRVLRKLGFDSTAQLVRYGLSRRIDH